MAPPLLTLVDTRLTFGGTPILDGADLTVGERERVCLVGRNGSGKSTLLKIAAGLVEADQVEIFRQPGTTVRYLPQEPDISAHDTVLDYVEAGLTAGDDTYRAQYLLGELGMTGAESTENLSGGEIRRAALARVLAPEPDIILLDEPTNHLDLPTIEWLERELKSMKSAMVLISHDRRFLENLSNAVIWLDRGTSRRMDRGFAHFEEWRDETLELEAQEQQKLKNKIAMEEHWLTYGVTARRKRNVRRLRQLHDLRAQRKHYTGPQGNVSMAAVEGNASGKRVMELDHVSKSYGDRPIISDFSTRILRGDRIGIIGPNGAGKTTMVKLLTGELEPDSGTAKTGTNLQSATLDQHRADLNKDIALRDVLTGGGSDMVMVGDNQRHVMSYMKDFLFQPEQARTSVQKLSGGERGRLMLARALARPSNLLVLDEPTNDLDLETLDLLQELLADYKGTVLLVSHDRDFIDRIATSVIVHEGPGHWQEYAGGYTDMVAQRGYGVGENAKAPEAAATKPSKSQGKPTKKADNTSRLTFKDKHALETLPDRMAKMERDIAKLQTILAEPDIYTKNPTRFEKATKKLEKTSADLARAEEQWLELEMKREELES